MQRLDKNLKACICAVNASYTHTSLARLCLEAACKDLPVLSAEFSVNDSCERVCGTLYRLNCDVYLFGCYIWNLTFLQTVARRLKSVKPQCIILFGGPEVSFDTERFMLENTYVDLCVRGEGDKAVPSLLGGEAFSEIPGVCYRDKGLHIQDCAYITDLDSLPRIYTPEILAGLKHKMIYYETSRGCPFRCSYCLSSTSHGVRYFSIERVKADFKMFMDAGVPLVKLTDRTFNVHPKRTAELLEYIIQNNQNTCFHFEISADILDEDTLRILENAPKGYFQLEIGVQTTNVLTSAAIDRHASFEKIKNNVTRLQKTNNMHMHLDLIAGLPHENYQSFKNSFDDVFALRPDMLQLGFLKLLKGTKISAQKDENEYVFTTEPPYEVLASKWLSYDEMLRLKQIEYVLELYYNSGTFTSALEYALRQSQLSAFSFFESLSEFWNENTVQGASYGQTQLYALFYRFVAENIGESELFRALLTYDLLKHNRTAKLENWTAVRPECKAFYEAAWEQVYASGVLSDDWTDIKHKEILKFVRLVRFEYNVFTCEVQDSIVVFDYKNRKTYCLAVENYEENNLR